MIRFNANCKTEEIVVKCLIENGFKAYWNTKGFTLEEVNEAKNYAKLMSEDHNTIKIYMYKQTVTVEQLDWNK